MKKVKVLGLALAFLAGACAETTKKSASPEDRARLLLDVAVAALQEGDAIDALERLFEAERLAPNVAEVHHCKALAYLAKRDSENALISARRAIEIAPNFSDALTTLGKILMDTGRLGEAATYLRKAVNDPIYRGAFKARTSLGIIAYRHADYENAQKHFDQAILEAPENACVARYYRGHLALQKGRYAKAIKDYKDATTKLCGRFSEAHFALGVALTRNREFDKARKKFVEITQLYPDTPIADKAKERLRYLP